MKNVEELRAELYIILEWAHKLERSKDLWYKKVDELHDDWQDKIEEVLRG